MSDQTTATGENQGGQPVSAPVQPEYITREEAQRLAETSADAAFRRAQGLITARDNKIQEKVREFDNFIALQKQHGVQITDDQAAKMKQAVITNAATELPSSPQTTVVPAQAEPEDDGSPAASIVTAMALDIEKEFGIELDENDPETRQVNTDGSPWQYLNTYRSALEAKKLRLQTPNNQPTAAPRTPTNLGAAGGAAAPVRTISVESAREALTKGLSKR